MTAGRAATWQEARREVERGLDAAGVISPAAEARWIVAEASGYEPSEFAEIAARAPSERARARLEEMTGRRAAGEPLQYVLGSWSFRRLDLMVDRRVLIPRPETEVVVEAALDALQADRSVPAPRVADLGTGSGAIALAIATEVPEAEVWATDVSADALVVARANAAGNAVRNVRFVEGDWFSALPDALRGSFDLVVSNPPYVAASEMDGLAPEVAQHEPHGALVAGVRGTECLEILVAGAAAWLARGGALVCEIAPGQAETVVGLARDAGYIEVAVRLDLAGRPRAVVARVRSTA
jgi:release factor glutamine methyltransferase